MHSLFLFLITVVAIKGILGDTKVIVHTKLGAIIGLKSSLNIFNVTYNYTVFKQIPYAQPPVGQLRFRKPVQYGHWKGTLDATTFGPSCIQPPYLLVAPLLPNLNQSEDCLFLNIYVPPTASSSNRKSVMIWIHGGAFAVGQGMLYDGSYLSVTGDVIIVTINYRLNVFGFFTTLDGSSAGNYGLWDQKLAIQWVKENIASFGGDTNSITIFGESAGGFSVSLQSLIPENRGLFHRVIAESGTGNSAVAMNIFPFKASDDVARSLNCSKESTSNTLACMQKRDSTDIYNAMLLVFKDNITDMHLTPQFGPVKDGDLIKQKPQDIIQDKNSSAYSFFKSLDIIIGTCTGEGSLLVDRIAAFQKEIPFNVSEGITSAFLCKYIIPLFVADYYNNDPAIAQAICQMYSSDGSLMEQGFKVVDFHGDVTFYYPTVEMLNVHAFQNQNSKQFQYLNRRRSFLSPSLKQYPWFPGTGHASELPMLFPMQDRTSPHELVLNYDIMRYWTNFAKTGDVNGQGLTNWPEYDIATRKYIAFDTNFILEDNLYKERMTFWSSLSQKKTAPLTTSCTGPDCTFG